ncbi:hypothetical protein BDA99DRAFT_513059 [Phascolomyces articulosus]|uniref:RNB domain-containing protein n=1 Tax=Phascolomyces articulosus TaxID=60185 RepID=A0AAD5PCY0_9FUNG|nr:hypothetical protein BDA99DRAFT_513059 [Phascolomyces articulosus]
MATKQQDTKKIPPSPTTETNPSPPIKKHHRGRRGSRRSSNKKKDTNSDTNDESPALQSVHDIIAEMRRLPNTTTTSEQQQPWSTVTSRRGRRHSEPFHQQRFPNSHIVDHHLSSSTTVGSLHHPLDATFPQQRPSTSSDEETYAAAEQIKHVVENQQGHLDSPKRVRSQSLPGQFNHNKPPITTNNDQSTTTTRRALYPTHLPIPDALHLIQKRQLYSGMLSVDRQDSSDAFVLGCESLGNEDIYIYGSRNRNRALDGDFVAVELVDVDTMLNEKASKKQARRRSSLAAATLHSIPEDTVLTDNTMEDVLPRQPPPPQQQQRPKYCGKVVSILERPKRMLFSGTLSLERPSSTVTATTPTGVLAPPIFFQPPSPTSSHFHHHPQQQQQKPSIIWFVPADKRLPLVAVPVRHAPYGFIKYHEEFRHRIFIGSIQRWPATSLHPFGTVEREIGLMGELSVHSQALMADHHLKDNCEFTKGVMKSADAIEDPLANDNITQKRLDLRHLSIFTVKDDQWSEYPTLLDHGFSIQVIKPEGGEEVYEIGIHTVDLASLIRPSTLLDREARDRAVTVQLVERQVPMLPLTFTSAHAELTPGKERSALSVICKMTCSGKPIHTWIGKSFIKSNEHLETEQVPKDMLDACKVLQTQRFNRGGSSLATSYQHFEQSDSTGGYPHAISRIQRKDNDPFILLKEVMILAGQEVGQKITSRFPENALLYRQPKQSTDKSSTAATTVKEQHYNRPSYFCSGNMDIAQYEHHPYGASLYTVFAEPLHQYACIAVQRQLHAALKGGEKESNHSTATTGTTDQENENNNDDTNANINNNNNKKDNHDAIDKLARHCSAKEYARDRAYSQSVALYTVAYIYRQCLDKKQSSLIKRATVLSIHPPSSLTLFIPEYGMKKDINLNHNKAIQSIEYDSEKDTMELVWHHHVDDNGNNRHSPQSSTTTTTTLLQPPPAMVGPTEQPPPENDLIFTVEQETNDQYQTMTIGYQSEIDVSLVSDMKVIRPGLDIQLVNPFSVHPKNNNCNTSSDNK